MARLLLVEDNELNRDLLCRRLERRGHEVLLAADGQQGLDLALAEGAGVKGDPRVWRSVEELSLKRHIAQADRALGARADRAPQ